MSRNALSIAILFAVTLTFAACQPKAPDTNRNAVAVATPEPVNTAAIEAEILKLEKEWAASAQKHDAETVGKMLADDLVITYPDGVVGTKSSELRDIASGAMTVESWEIQDTKVTVLGANSAFITGRAVIKNGKFKAPEAKSAIDISGEYRFIDIYAKRNGQWLAVGSQTTKIDKPAPAPPSPSPTESAKAPAAPSPAASPK